MAAGSPFHKRHNFAETDPRIRTELRKADILLKKEMERLEKQTRATTSYISDHQQALKMSWRRLEMQRKQDESPTVNRRTRRTGSLSNDRKRLLFSTSVSMDIPSSGHQQQPGTSQGRPHTRGSFDDGLTSSDSVPTLLPPIDNDLIINRPHTRGLMKTSPYISSPHVYKRQAPTLPLINGDMNHPLASTTTTSTVATKQVTGRSRTGSSSSGCELESTISATNTDDSTVTIPVNSKTVKKEDLLKAKELMNIKVYNSKSFEQFYSSSDVTGEQSRIRLDLLNSETEPPSEEEMMKQLTLEEQEKFKKAQEENSEMTLAKMFEQIKNCRYIRHYRPNGSAEEEEENGTEDKEDRNNLTLQNTALPF